MKISFLIVGILFAMILSTQAHALSFSNPTNMTYNSSSVPLEWSSPSAWVRYSITNVANDQLIQANTTLNLADGNYQLSGWTTENDTNATATVYFTVLKVNPTTGWCDFAMNLLNQYNCAQLTNVSITKVTCDNSDLQKSLDTCQNDLMRNINSVHDVCTISKEEIDSAIMSPFLWLISSIFCILVGMFIMWWFGVRGGGMDG